MCQTNKLHSVENGQRNSDIEPKLQDDLSPAPKKGFYMDEAISNIKFGLFNYILILVSGMVLFAVAMETCGISYVLPMSECDMNLSTSDEGILTAVPFAGIICSSHLWGFLADTKGRRRVLQPTLLAAFLISVASSFVQNFYLFTTLRFLNGFFISGGSATTYAYLSEFHDSTQRGRAIIGSSIIFGIACILLPFIAWGVINQDWQFDVPLIDITYKPWRLFLVTCSLPGLFSFVILMFLPESPKFILGQGKQVEAYQILQKMNRVNNGKKSSLEPFEIYEEPESIENRQRILDSKKSRFPLLSSVWIQTAPLFKPPYLSSTLLICFIMFTTYVTMNGFFMFFVVILNKMATNLNDVTGQRVMMCDVINSKSNINVTAEVCTTKLETETLEQILISEVLYAICFVVIGLLINRVGKFPILFAALVVPGLCGIICAITDIPLLQIAAFITVMLSGVCPHVIGAATVEIYPTALRSMAVSISLIFGRLGTVSGTNMVALLLDNHCEMVFYLSGSSLIVAGLLSFFIPKIHQKPKKAQNEPRVSVLSSR